MSDKSRFASHTLVGGGVESRKIKYKDISISGIDVKRGSAEKGGFYSNPISMNLPNGSIPLSATIYGSFDEGSSVVLQPDGIVIQSTISKTISSKNIRMVRIVYV